MMRMSTAAPRSPRYACNSAILARDDQCRLAIRDDAAAGEGVSASDERAIRMLLNQGRRP
jgi:hypothetical protein